MHPEMSNALARARVEELLQHGARRDATRLLRPHARRSGSRGGLAIWIAAHVHWLATPPETADMTHDHDPHTAASEALR